MQTLNYWQKFETTGKVEDYLKYCSDSKSLDTLSENKEKTLEVNPYAGTDMCYGNSVETDAYR